MPTYRVSIDATICFDVTAKTPEEATHKAGTILDTWVDDCEGADLEGLKHGRVYPRHDTELPEVEDITEDDEA